METEVGRRQLCVWWGDLENEKERERERERERALRLFKWWKH